MSSVPRKYDPVVASDLGAAPPQAARRLWSPALALVALLAAQYTILQLLTGVQYGDAPRNLHWGIYTFEEPGFLLNVEDVYDRINGFPPSPPSLSPTGTATGHSAPLHSWWGPLYPLLFAAIWGLTGSYTLLQLIVPLAAGGVVLLTYSFGVRYFNHRTALLAAILLATFPVYHEHASLSYLEPLSALLLAAALWSFLAHRTMLTILYGTLSVLGKIDLIFLYYGSILLTALLSRTDREARLSRRHLGLSLALPLLVLLPWLYLVYVSYGRPTTVSGGPSWAIFQRMAPLIFEQLFMIRWQGTLMILALLGVPLYQAVRQRPHASPLIYRLLGIWLLLGCSVLLLYAAMPGASNSPRVFIPTLPPLVLLIAAGLDQLQRRWRNYLIGLVLPVFLLMSSIGVLFQVVEAQWYNAARPVWEALRHQPHGIVMTEYYWHAALYARQPVTWFEKDPQLEHNILHKLTHFKRYTAEHAIRYIVLPQDEVKHIARSTALAQTYKQLPIGRRLRSRSTTLTAPEVRSFLATHYPSLSVGDFIVFILY